jgi:hypothetical protein
VQSAEADAKIRSPLGLPRGGPHHAVHCGLIESWNSIGGFRVERLSRLHDSLLNILARAGFDKRAIALPALNAFLANFELYYRHSGRYFMQHKRSASQIVAA